MIISNELLGGSSPDRIAAGVASVQPADVHVIFSARDFARQLVSDWQEHVKHKHRVTLEQFVDDLVEKGLDAPPPFGELFWGMHDAAYVLQRWATVVPPENIHLVTVPQPGAPRDTLWRRFCQVTGVDPDAYETETKRSNTSMGVAETELIRRMNEDARSIRDDDYDRLVRIVLAERILGGQSPRLTLPPDHLEWVSQRSRQLIDELKGAGYQVEGDLEELMPDPASHATYVSPTRAHRGRPGAGRDPRRRGAAPALRDAALEGPRAPGAGRPAAGAQADATGPGPGLLAQPGPGRPGAAQAGSAPPLTRAPAGAAGSPRWRARRRRLRTLRASLRGRLAGGRDDRAGLAATKVPSRPRDRSSRVASSTSSGLAPSGSPSSGRRSSRSPMMR